MRILCLEHEQKDATATDFAPHLKTEAARMWELQQADVVREAYLRADRSEAVLILECRDTIEARVILNTIPLVQAGLIDFEIIPLRPYPGYARLFNEAA